MAWAKLGSTKIEGDTLGTADFTENYTTPTHTWTQVGTTVSVTSGVARSDNAGTNNGDRVTAPLGLTLSDTKWTCDFDFIYTSNSSATYPVTLASSTGATNTATHDVIAMLLDSGNAILVYKDGASSQVTTGSQALSTSTQYYCRLTRDSTTQFTLKIYTDSTRTTQHGSTLTQSSLPATVGGLTTIQHGSYNSGGATSGQTWDVDNVNIYDGLSTVGTPAATITVDSLTAKKHLMVNYKLINDGSGLNSYTQFNADTGNNYAWRGSDNGGTDSTGTSTDRINDVVSVDPASQVIQCNYHIINEAAKEKLIEGSTNANNQNGAGNAPERREFTGKWSNTSNAITEIKITNTGGGDFAEGSEVTVYGTD